MNLRFRSIFATLVIAVSCGVAEAQFSRTDSTRAIELQTLNRDVGPIYRKPTAKELKEVEPSPALLAKYADFLRASGTGITRLIKDRGCATNPTVVDVREECLKYSMPGAGSSFSFRTKTYRISRLADLTYTDGSFQTLGNWQLGILVNLGDVPIDGVSVQTNGMKFLNEFQPASEFEKNKVSETELTTGVVRDGFAYRRGFFVVENSTFALRSIAFKGSVPRTINGLKYDELDYDKRRDVTVVFRVVEREQNGDSVTIIWRVLAERDAPTLKKEKEKDEKD